MNAKILNREFQHPADGWYQIEALGRHPNRAARVVQVIDDEACQTIVNRFNADAEAGKLSHGGEMLIDHEHFKHDAGKETIAYGWLQKLEARPDGYYGRIRWTGTGRQAVDTGDYRFFSTEYDPADLQSAESASAENAATAGGGKLKTVRPLRLDGLTLTNDPNNRGAKPITNRTNFAGAGALAANQSAATDSVADKSKPKTPMKNAATKLGLAPEASEDAILGAVTTLLNRVSTLESENQMLLGEQVDAILDAHQVKEEKLRNRLKLVLAGLQNRAERIAALGDLGIRPGDARTFTATRVLNRGGGTPPPVSQGADAQTRRATKVMNRAQALMKETPNLSLATAFGMAEREAE
jgi:phage I-like protein